MIGRSIQARQLGPWWLSKFVDAAREADLPLAYVVLRPPLDVTRQSSPRRDSHSEWRIALAEGLAPAR
ncbi:hypothetical protein [Nannocystis punicea]|uniref:Uncharacterized protein n=1 Tax=Nannocystis punicea TaxID=2995304 RepID=A0ABY7H6B0_9BACT|nr:hypothetical protein [Nannocystis poenicansa]WAS94564.1 hypothetical protein O0S08_00255 [Nannocystis poenicansa]